MIEKNSFGTITLTARMAVAVLSLMAFHITATRAQDSYRYAPHSVLSTGSWIKIGVGASGVYELSDSLLMAAGFNDPEKVRIYGYGGKAQPEKLTAAYLEATDDLPQVPMAIIGGRRLFWAEGPVGWETATAVERTRNPYSSAGYYFITEDGGDEPVLTDSALFAKAVSEQPENFHFICEPEEYAWYHGGRNLYETSVFEIGTPRSYTVCTDGRTKAQLTVALSYDGYFEATVNIGDREAGKIVINKSTTSGLNGRNYPDKYSKGAADVWTFDVDELPEADSVGVTITQTSGATVRLDRIEMCFDSPTPLDRFLARQLPQPFVAGRIDTQDRHADGPADMVIIIPGSGKLAEQARRVAELHEELDTMRVRIVRADELYNEFSSGTPDANAYRRYMKMLYDRAEGDADTPRYLLLMGDAAFDNRMLTSNFRALDPADFLLCYESENSFSETACYVTDDYFAMLDDDDGGDLLKIDKSDIAVGRLPARTAEEASVMVDKLYSYSRNEKAGAWQNEICLMGDDGNANMHMNDAESIAGIIENEWPDYHLTKVYWDAYARTTVATGYAYPDVSRIILQKMVDGALLMNYTGHGSPTKLSHENVIMLPDFKLSSGLRLPLWFTASCDVAPFDGYTENIGEQAMLNPTGGAVAFIGTTRTVYATHNRAMNKAFMSYVLRIAEDGHPMPVGEALRRAKNDQVKGVRTSTQAGINKFHFSLLGDPALRLPLPTDRVVVDSIDGIPAGDGIPCLLAGDSVTVSGHVVHHPDMNGMVTLTVKDAMQTITCRMNPLDKSEMPSKPLVYEDRPGILFTGSDSLRNGRFSITFAVPKDIMYSDSTGLMLVYAVNDARDVVAHGSYGDFTMGSADTYDADGLGPAIIAWLESPLFVNGGATSSRPLLHADIYDPDGINASGSGIGHDIELAVDGQSEMTYNLNSYFNYTFGDFKEGTVEFTLPLLDEGRHYLTLRAWDVLNFSSVVNIDFVVGAAGDMSGIYDAGCDGGAYTGAYDLMGRRAAVSGCRYGSMLLKRGKDGRIKKILQRKQ